MGHESKTSSWKHWGTVEYYPPFRNRETTSVVRYKIEYKQSKEKSSENGRVVTHEYRIPELGQGASSSCNEPFWVWEQFPRKLMVGIDEKGKVLNLEATLETQMEESAILKKRYSDWATSEKGHRQLEANLLFSLMAFRPFTFITKKDGSDHYKQVGMDISGCNIVVNYQFSGGEKYELRRFTGFKKLKYFQNCRDFR